MIKVIFALLVPAVVNAQSLKGLNNQKSPFSLPKLSYATSALAPVIDQQTMELHYGKHHQAYIDKLNEALASTKNKKNLLGILQSTKEFPMAVRNNAGGHWNHSFFWTLLVNENKKTQPTAAFLKDIEKTFGSLDKFKEQFEAAALSVFGSGWAWLIKDEKGQLQITTTPNQDNPLMDVAAVKGKPILGLDVWEHAYYLTYQNRRADYTKNFWKIVNWNQASKYYTER